MRTRISSSPSRTYVVCVYSIDFKSVSFKQFTLSEEAENSCEFATWYFYNRLDLGSCGDSAYPLEMHNDIDKI
jgi:hypothetical protein